MKRDFSTEPATSTSSPKGRRTQRCPYCEAPLRGSERSCPVCEKPLGRRMADRMEAKA